MKLGQTSLLELPITLLRFIFKRVDNYYGGVSRHTDAFEHVWTSIIFGLLFSHFSWLFATIGMIIVWVVHVLVKEVILDKPKRDSGDPHEKQAFVIDMITRNSGWIFGVIIMTVIKLCH